jgi:hypothetical protein
MVSFPGFSCSFGGDTLPSGKLEAELLNLVVSDGDFFRFHEAEMNRRGRHVVPGRRATRKLRPEIFR